ncbi:hypothetical protein PVAP13_9NG600514 [Panicum virgatum]|uniref:Uncharacterized protein n=1 Tax=Panicum virgatum TaxID=38727 RepID=A0A8T0MMK5_PANVG|nr:hypothetical protein PVAP13_9NG600514 [Panicum virgatum]
MIGRDNITIPVGSIVANIHPPYALFILFWSSRIPSMSSHRLCYNYSRLYYSLYVRKKNMSEREPRGARARPAGSGGAGCSSGRGGGWWCPAPHSAPCKIFIERLPLYAWCEEGVRQALGDCCCFDYIDPVSFTQENTEFLQCWVWMWSPDQLPRSKLTTFFPERAGRSSPGVTAPAAAVWWTCSFISTGISTRARHRSLTHQAPGRAGCRPPPLRTRRGGRFLSSGSSPGTLGCWMGACLRAGLPGLPQPAGAGRPRRVANATPTTTTTTATFAVTGRTTSTPVVGRGMTLLCADSRTWGADTAPVRRLRRVAAMMLTPAA